MTIQEEMPLNRPEEFLSLIRKIRKRLHQEYHATAEKHDLTIPQLHTLVRLWHSDNQPISKISSGLGLAASTTSGIIDRLEGKGLVTRRRDEIDRRIVTVQLTAEGSALKTKLSRIIEQKYLTGIFSQLDERTSEELINGLRVICQIMTKGAN
ncbi:MarR family transcriptional regulator [Candidatus Acetothermia bacterium]|jgi:DNA-binding MarR family transcriptional regulator|nr:MarR family transcriptional regulator [Candidatus Acetothermia bacterium]MCI2426286.1 MarR family transcriptional regulator [Candidatus Acetothermia bacterium]MCI2427920.1 MarR family transcriptional regulator [Candidatus Acetothermia bacterium]MCI2428613.1 MarR family transcriptional regulator [Candidatus Acetothermia bacterium]